MRCCLYPPGCSGPLKPVVVDAIEFSSRFPADSVLVLGESDELVSLQKYNFWLAQLNKTEGQGFTIKLDKCARMIAGCQIKNKGAGAHPNKATKSFRVSGSLNEKGPWQTLVEDELADTTGGFPAALLNFTFEKPVEIQFMKFDLISFWRDGGGLQYFAAIPATGKSMSVRILKSRIYFFHQGDFSPWTEWTRCCNGERRKTRTWNLDQGRTETVTETEDCPKDEYPGKS